MLCAIFQLSAFDVMDKVCKGITPYMTVCSLATLTTKHSIICLYMVLY